VFDLQANFTRGEQSWTVPINPGESLMSAAVKHGVDGIVGECGGDMSCATCHVYITAPWSELLADPSFAETELLEVVDDPRDTSRLACQIEMSARLDGIEVEVPPSS
jgi:ferredoxin, 2Fe-2S